MENIEKNLNMYREEINNIDKNIIALFLKRMNISEKIVEQKIKKNLKILDLDREKEILNQIKITYNGNKFKREILFLINYIMNQSKSRQVEYLQNITPKYEINVNERIELKGKVAFQGVLGSYSHEALDSFFLRKCSNSDVEIVNYKTFKEVFESVNKGISQFGILPIENSYAGSVIEVIDLLKDFDVNIIGEKIIEVNHCVVGIEEASFKDITTLYSHPQAFLQTSEYFKKYPNILKIPYFNTAMSAEKVKNDRKKNVAAIASKKSAKIYNLKILKENINNSKKNYTKFIIISKKNINYGLANKVSIIFSVEHNSGSLYKILEYFAVNGINLLKLESRPIRNSPWEYMFYLDLEGTLKSIKMKTAIDIIKSKCIYFRILGEYKKDEIE